MIIHHHIFIVDPVAGDVYMNNSLRRKLDRVVCKIDDDLSDAHRISQKGVGYIVIARNKELDLFVSYTVLKDIRNIIDLGKGLISVRKNLHFSCLDL